MPYSLAAAWEQLQKTLWPQTLVTAGALLILLLQTAWPRARQKVMAALTIVTLAVAAMASIFSYDMPQTGFNSMVVADNLSVYLNLVILGATFLTVLLSPQYLNELKIASGEYYCLLLFATLGMMLLTASTDLMTLFLSLETLSIALYVLAGYARTQGQSNEAGLKYLLLGAFATGFLLYGMALLYGATGTTNLHAIALALGERLGQGDLMLTAGLGMLAVGLAFKLAFVPFHMWVPDVYQGAPTPVTAFMAAAVKAAGFATLLRVFPASMVMGSEEWRGVLWLLAVLTMTVGNVIALAQANLKRMFAYSSIAHAGYALIGLVVSSDWGRSGLLFYLVAYTLMTIGAFALVIALASEGGEHTEIAHVAGLGSRRPWLAAAMTIFLVSLSGIPPTAGFLGKWVLFSSAVERGFLGLAILGVLNSLISVYYYLRVVVAMYMEQPREELALGRCGPAAGLALLLAALGSLALGLWPGPLLEVAQQAVKWLS